MSSAIAPSIQNLHWPYKSQHFLLSRILPNYSHCNTSRTCLEYPSHATGENKLSKIWNPKDKPISTSLRRLGIRPQNPKCNLSPWKVHTLTPYRSTLITLNLVLQLNWSLRKKVLNKLWDKSGKDNLTQCLHSAWTWFSVWNSESQMKYSNFS